MKYIKHPCSHYGNTEEPRRTSSFIAIVGVSVKMGWMTSHRQVLQNSIKKNMRSCWIYNILWKFLYLSLGICLKTYDRSAELEEEYLRHIYVNITIIEKMLHLVLISKDKLFLQAHIALDILFPPWRVGRGFAQSITLSS